MQMIPIGLNGIIFSSSIIINLAVLVIGTCYVDKLKKAIKFIGDKHNKTCDLIKKFTECKFKLQDQIISAVFLSTVILPAYDNCTIGISCKLKNLKMLLKQKKMMLEKELKFEMSGWGKTTILMYFE